MEAKHHRIRPAGRICLAMVAVVIFGLACLGYEVTRGITGTVGIGAPELAFLAPGVYALLVSLSGHWTLFKRDRLPRSEIRQLSGSLRETTGSAPDE